MKFTGWKTQDWKTWDQITGVEKAGHGNTACTERVPRSVMYD